MKLTFRVQTFAKKLLNQNFVNKLFCFKLNLADNLVTRSSSDSENWDQNIINNFYQCRRKVSFLINF